MTAASRSHPRPDVDVVDAPPLDLDVSVVRKQFPILDQEVNGHPLVYLDNAASAQRPQSVIDAVRLYDERDHANVHRGVHTLSQRATDAFEHARERVRAFLNAREAREVIFTRGTTEAINLVANSYGVRLQAGDEILVTHMEHHSNIVPWQLLAERTGATLRPVPISQAGELDMVAYREMLGPKTRIVAMIHVSNAIGTINPVKEMVRLARETGAMTLIDGAQAVPHLRVDVQDIDCDFYAFSGHKMYGPTGIGALYGRAELLEQMPPWQGGGEMILEVRFNGTRYAPLPAKFEAGTPNIAGAIGLGAAVDFIETLTPEAIGAWEHELLEYATDLLSDLKGARVIGTAAEKAGALSFALDGIHPHDIGTILDSEGVAVRTGHHCAQPVMDFFRVPATARASFASYNTHEDVDRLIDALRVAQKVFG
ncbi:MAG: cysteine desulfurase [Pseudomonadota bacterium]